MASRRPAFRLFAQCKAQGQLSSQKLSNSFRASRRSVSTYPGAPSSHQNASSYSRYLSWAAFSLLAVSPLAYKMVCCLACFPIGPQSLSYQFRAHQYARAPRLSKNPYNSTPQRSPSAMRWRRKSKVSQIPRQCACVWRSLSRSSRRRLCAH